MLHYYYADSLPNALLKNYPGRNANGAISFSEYPWKMWRFNQVPKGFWRNEENIKKAVETLQTELNIRSPSDWKKITKVGAC